jgi:hypothetical protein
VRTVNATGGAAVLAAAASQPSSQAPTGEVPVPVGGVAVATGVLTGSTRSPEAASTGGPSSSATAGSAGAGGSGASPSRLNVAVVERTVGTVVKAALVKAATPAASQTLRVVTTATGAAGGARPTSLVQAAARQIDAASGAGRGTPATARAIVAGVSGLAAGPTGGPHLKPVLGTGETVSRPPRRPLPPAGLPAGPLTGEPLAGSALSPGILGTSAAPASAGPGAYEPGSAHGAEAAISVSSSSAPGSPREPGGGGAPVSSAAAAAACAGLALALLWLAAVALPGATRRLRSRAELYLAAPFELILQRPG